MKKIISVISGLSVMAACVSFNIAYASGAEITVGSVDAEAGSTISVPITLSGNPGILGMVLNVEYDKDLTLTGCELGEALSTLDPIASGNYSVYPFKLLWAGLDTNDTSNGTLATLTFSVPDDAEGSYEVKAYVGTNSVYDQTDAAVAVTVNNGSITIPEPEEHVVVTSGGESEENEREGGTYDKVYSYTISVPQDITVTPDDITVQIGNAIATKHPSFYEKIGALTGAGDVQFTSAITKIPVGETVTGVRCVVSVSYALGGEPKQDQYSFTLE